MQYRIHRKSGSKKGVFQKRLFETRQPGKDLFSRLIILLKNEIVKNAADFSFSFFLEKYSRSHGESFELSKGTLSRDF
jgi:hypothetical protein